MRPVLNDTAHASCSWKPNNAGCRYMLIQSTNCRASPLTGSCNVNAGEEHHCRSDSTQRSHDCLVVLVTRHGHNEGHRPLGEQLPHCLCQSCGRLCRVSTIQHQPVVGAALPAGCLYHLHHQDVAAELSTAKYIYWRSDCSHLCSQAMAKNEKSRLLSVIMGASVPIETAQGSGRGKPSGSMQSMS